MKYCNECGTQIPAQAKFCNSCGATCEAVQTTAQTESPSQTQYQPMPNLDQTQPQSQNQQYQPQSTPQQNYQQAQSYPPQGQYPPQQFPNQPQPQYYGPQGSGLKSKMTAGLLGIFLGWTGAHQFYLGRKPLAWAHLGAAIAGFLLLFVGIGIVIMIGNSIWGVVEGIMILTGHTNTDADGNPLAQ
jgi:TM2 domain-containing membrane protein YozV